MADRKIKYDLDVDSRKGEKALSDTEAAAGDLEEQFEDTRTAAQKAADLIVAASAQAEAAIKDQESAAEALKVELDKLGSSYSADQGVAELQRLGLTCDDIRADADQLAAALKQAGDTEVKVDTHRAKQGIDDLGASANSSKSTLANMVGNSAQDIGELGGIAGSAGVAFGQMGEYMADALGSGDRLGNVLKNFAGVAGPIAALAVGVQLVSTWMENVAQSKAFHRKRVDEFAEAISEAETAMEGFEQHFKDQKKVEFVDADGDIRDATRALALFGETFVTFQDKALKGETGVKAFIDEVVKGNPELADLGKKAMDAQFSQQYLNSALESGDPLTRRFAEAIVALRQANVDYRDAGGAAAAQTAFWGTEVGDATEKAKKLETATRDVSAAVDHMGESARDGKDDLAGLKSETEKAYYALETLLGSLRNDEAWDNLKTKIDEYKWKMAEGKLSTDEQRDATRDLKIEIGEYVLALDGLPAEVVSQVKTLIDKASFDEAERLLAFLARGRPIQLWVNAPKNASPYVDIGKQGDSFSGNSATASGNSFAGRPLVVNTAVIVDGQVIEQSQQRWRRGLI